MTSKRFLVFLATAFAIAVSLIANVSAFGSIVDLEVNGVEALDAAKVPITVFSGQTVPVRVEFKTLENAEDVRVKAWISGERELASISERFDVIENRTYSRVLSVQVPNDLDELDETLELNVVVENRNDGTADEKEILLTLQRESYVVEILDVDMASKVSAGEVLTLDVVVKNIGRQFADDTFVRVSIPALEIEDRAFLGDLAFLDQPFGDNPFEIENEFDRLDKEDSMERRLFLRIPSNAKPGLYEVEVSAFNDDSETVLIRKIVIAGAEASTNVIAPVHSKSFNVGETGEYSIVLVNSGTQLKVFEFVIESPTGLNIDVSEPIVAIPAGTSKTVKLSVNADKAESYDFAVNVHSDSELIKRESFTANVQGRQAVTTSPTVLLTVVLAVIFVVLLIVLIVLLTRKPGKAEEAGEGYY